MKCYQHATTDSKKVIDREVKDHFLRVWDTLAKAMDACKPIGVMASEDELNTDVYCPYCGTNLSGLYGEEPTKIIQCYGCGNYLDNTKLITKEEAEKALAERAKL